MSQRWNNNSMIKHTHRFHIYLLPAIVTLLIGCGQKAPVVEVVEQPVAEQPLLTPEEIEENAGIEKQRLYQQGIDALSLREYDEAQIIFAEFIEKYPSMAGAYVNLALIAYRQENFESSESLVAKAIELNPAQAQAYHLRAQLHLKNGDIKKAMTDYIEAITIKPDYINAHYNLALLYDIYLQDIEQAIQQYSIYLSILDKEDETTKDWIEHLRRSIGNG